MDMTLLDQLNALLGSKNTPVQSPGMANANSPAMLQALTQYQQDLQKRPGTIPPEAFDRQNPREYVGLPEHEDDQFGY